MSSAPSTAPQAGTSRNGASPSGLPDASLVESVRVLLTAIVPALARGLFSPRRRAQGVLTRLNMDRRAVQTLQAVRRKHGGPGAKLLGGRMIVLWGRDVLTDVLDRSATDFSSGGGAKGKGMAHFQPDALTLSCGAEWRDRRAFNEHVLASAEAAHPDAERMLAVVADEVARLPRGELSWERWESLFDRLTQRVIFGDRYADDEELSELLEHLMGEANRLVGTGRHGERFYALYGRLEQTLIDPEPGTLIARIAAAPQSDATRVVRQIPHWMFAMRDTLGANAFRALAAIAANPAVEERVRTELDGVDLGDSAAVAGLSYLAGCLHEAMRLWPTTPLLAREAVHDTEIAGAEVPEGTQVMIVNTFNHRDTDAIPDADRFVPERWESGERDIRFNHLSNGTQDCPGGALVLLLGAAVLGRVLSGGSWRLVEPELASGGALPNMLDFFRARLVAV